MRIEAYRLSVSSEYKRSRAKPFTTLLLEHLPYLTMLVVYMFVAFAVEYILGRESLSGLTLRFGILFLFTILFFSCLLCIGFFMKLARRLARMIEIHTGQARIKNQISKYAFTYERIGGFVIVYVTIPVFLSIFSNVKQSIPLINPFMWDRTFMRLDYLLHGGQHPWILLQSFLGHPPVTKVIDYFYVSWFFSLFVFLIWMGWSNRRQLRAQFFFSFVLIWIVVGMILATLFSSAGPCYYAEVTSEVGPYGPLMSYLDSIHENGFLFARKFQKGLWEAYAGNSLLLFGGISAMPSVHVATTVLYALVGLRINRVIGTLLIFYAIIIQIGSIHLGWHFAIDGYFGSLLTICIWKITGWVINRYRLTPCD